MSNEIEDIQKLEIKHIMATRQWFYDFLAKSFYTEPNIHRLKEAFQTKVFTELLNEAGESNQGVYFLCQFLNNIEKISPLEIEELKLEYNRLFIGPNHLPAPPWESVYLSKEKIIFDEHTLAVREFYKRWNVTTKNKNKEPDDHIGFELEFMAILIGRSIKALNENNMKYFSSTIISQKEFLETHPLVWIDKFSSKLYNSTSHHFYKGLALFTPEYLRMDIELLKDIIYSFNIFIES